MISFLVKLADLLDNRGQHSMAREVDDLIEKIAQATWLDSWVGNNQKLEPMLAGLKELISMNAANIGPSSKQPLQALNQSIGWLNSLSKDSVSNATVDQANKWGDYLGKAVFDPIQAAIDSGKLGGNFEAKYYGIKEQMNPVLDEIAKYSENVRTQLDNPVTETAPAEQQSPGVANKAPAKKHSPVRQDAGTIKLIQNALSIPVSGKWDPATNKAFVAYMNENYPIAMKNNVFVGPEIDNKGTRGGNKLSDAWELIKEKGVSQQQLAEEMKNKPPQEGHASKAPATAPKSGPTGNWKSKYFKITPSLQGLLSQWEGVRGKGSGQTLLDTFDKSPGQTQQSLEAFIKENLA